VSLHRNFWLLATACLGLTDASFARPLWQDIGFRTSLGELKSRHPSLRQTMYKDIFELPERAEITPRCLAAVQIRVRQNLVQSVELVGEPQVNEVCRNAVRKVYRNLYGKPMTRSFVDRWLDQDVSISLRSDPYSPDPPVDGMLTYQWRLVFTGVEKNP
jgi:hypothetical protein